MNKFTKMSFFATLLIVTILQITNVFAATTAEEIALLKDEVAKLKIANCCRACCGGASKESTLSSLGLTSKGYGTFVVQGTPKINIPGIHSSLLYGWSLTKKVSEDSLVHMHIKGAVGSGLNAGLNDELKVYSDINSAASATDSNLQIVEFLYHQDLFNKKLQLLFGKLNPTAYFDDNKIANDGTTQFLASMFVNNPAIAFPSYTLGLRAMYSPVSFLDVEYGYFSQDDEKWNKIDKSNFNIVEGTCKISDTGNYRFMYWETFGNKERTFGYGLSFDQSLSKIVTLFTRYGRQNPQKAEAKACNISDSWSFGAQLNGDLWTRDMDRIGIAFGQNVPSKKWATEWNCSTTPETQTECYYSFYLNNNVTLTPVVQCVFKPYGGNTVYKGDIDIYAFGIRTNITF